MYAILLDAAAAQEVTREAFLRAGDWSRGEVTRAWLLGTAVRLAIIKDQDAGPGEAEADDQDLVAWLMRPLTVEQRALVTLSSYQHLTSGEIVDQVGLPAGAVRSRLGQAVALTQGLDAVSPPPVDAVLPALPPAPRDETAVATITRFGGFGLPRRGWARAVAALLVLAAITGIGSAWVLGVGRGNVTAPPVARRVAPPPSASPLPPGPASPQPGAAPPPAATATTRPSTAPSTPPPGRPRPTATPAQVRSATPTPVPAATPAPSTAPPPAAPPATTKPPTPAPSVRATPPPPAPAATPRPCRRLLGVICISG